jgi:hypothetical protein
MTLEGIAVLYAAVGVGTTCAHIARGGRRPLDALLVLLLWPLYGPFALARGGAEGRSEVGDERAAGFLAALRGAARSPLADLLPGEETVVALARRLELAQRRIGEIDALLARPEFSEVDARARQEAPTASEAARQSAGIRVLNIRRLRGLRNRTARELEEVGELLTQLTTQAEVVRLVGTADPTTEELVRELVSRVEGLEQILEDDDPREEPAP